MDCPRCHAPATADLLQEFGGVCPKCLLAFATERDAPSFPNLEIVEMIGQGGMGVVYKALQKNLNRTVALKVLSPRFSDDPEFLERFTREAQALAQLSHPNIVAIHDSGIHDRVPYLVMEYVEGRSLRALLQSREITVAQVLDLIPQLCDALQYAHGRGVVHRDIKPENILVDAQGRVKIADYGLAKLAGAQDTRLTKTGYTMGTPHYMAPEQVENSSEVDHRADIYSLGVIFYEMLTGELPLGRFKAPSEKGLGDHRLDPVVLKSLEKEPADRYQSAGEVKAQLADLDKVSPVAPAFPPYSKVAVASGVVSLLTLALFLLFLVFAGTRDSAAAAFGLMTGVSLLAAFGLSIGGIAATFRSRGALRGGWIAVTSLIFSILSLPLALGGLIFVPATASQHSPSRLSKVRPMEPTRRSERIWRHEKSDGKHYRGLVSTQHAVIGISDTLDSIDPETGLVTSQRTPTIWDYAAADNWLAVWGDEKVRLFESTASGLVERSTLPQPFLVWISGGTINAGVLYLQSHEGHLAAIDLGKGQVLWNSGPSPVGALDGPPVITPSNVLTFEKTGIQVRDRVTGQVKDWMPEKVAPTRTLQWPEGYAFLRDGADFILISPFDKNGYATMKVSPTSRAVAADCHLALIKDYAVLTTVHQVFGLPRRGTRPPSWNGFSIPDTTGPLVGVDDLLVAIPTVEGLFLLNTEDGANDSLLMEEDRGFTALACWNGILVGYNRKTGIFAGYHIAGAQPRSR
jgi:predicted Ser/Thr protein kinase